MCTEIRIVTNNIEADQTHYNGSPACSTITDIVI